MRKDLLLSAVMAVVLPGAGIPGVSGSPGRLYSAPTTRRIPQHDAERMAAAQAKRDRRAAKRVRPA